MLLWINRFLPDRLLSIGNPGIVWKVKRYLYGDACSEEVARPLRDKNAGFGIHAFGN